MPTKGHNQFQDFHPTRVKSSSERELEQSKRALTEQRTQAPAPRFPPAENLPPQARRRAERSEPALARAPREPLMRRLGARLSAFEKGAAPMVEELQGQLARLREAVNGGAQATRALGRMPWRFARLAWSSLHPS